MKLFTGILESPIGLIEVKSTLKEVISVNFVNNRKNSSPNPPTILKRCIEQLGEYFSGTRKKFDIPILLEGTNFQKQVWSELLDISYGKTVSYLHIAQNLGNRKATRAVGSANSRNPIAIIIPCHRVIGSTGKLTGYAGGLERKKWLLDHEKGRLNLTKFV